MKKKLMFLAIAALSTMASFAETLSETNKKYPTEVCVFLKTPAVKGDLKNFDIERIAFLKEPPRVAIKITQREKDIIKTISSTMDGEEYSIGLHFTDGSALAIDNDAEYMVYMSTKQQGATFLVDKEKIIAYELLFQK